MTTEPAAVHSRMPLWAGLWFGLIAGLLELVVLAGHKWTSATPLFVSRDVLWMAPVANAVLIGGVVFLVLLVSGRSLRVGSMVGGALVALAVILHFPSIHWLASAALALGVGTLWSRRAVGAPERALATLRRTAPILALVIVVAAAASWWWRRERPTTAEPRAGANNVLLLVLDTVRAQSLSLYGHSRETTPALDALAAESVVFDRAFAPSPWTLPTHASMFTGKPPHQLDYGWSEPLSDQEPTLAESLRDRGWDCAGFAANLNYCNWEMGLDRGFGYWDDYPISSGQLVLSASIGRALANSEWCRGVLDNDDNLNRRPARSINDAFLAWHGEQPRSRPFFAFLNYYDAHQPYLPPERFRSWVKQDVERGPMRYETNLVEIQDWLSLSRAQVKLENQLYDGCLAWLDAEIGALLAELRKRGVLEDTWLVITSDHGEQFGEHQLYDHGNSLYTQLVHVPLMIRPPGGTAGRRVATTVGLEDLPATVLAALAIDDTDLPGRDLMAAELEARPLIGSVEALDGYRAGEMWSLLVGNVHYILNGDKSEELYDYVADPLERIDLTTRKEWRLELPKYRAALEKVLGDG